MSRDVLIIDDDSRTRSRVRAALEREGMQVVELDPCSRPITETLGAGTLHAGTLQPSYAVILVDIVMPEKDGFEYLRDIRRIWPDQRLIVYSQGLSNYTHYAVKLGADAGIDISHADNLRHLVETARRLATQATRPGSADAGGSGNSLGNGGTGRCG